jgi:hypothetical protein
MYLCNSMLRPSPCAMSSKVLTNSSPCVGFFGLLSMRGPEVFGLGALLILMSLSTDKNGSSTSWMLYRPLDTRLQKSAYLSLLSLSVSKNVKICRITSLVKLGPTSFMSVTPLIKSLKSRYPYLRESNALKASDAFSNILLMLVPRALMCSWS